MVAKVVELIGWVGAAAAVTAITFTRISIVVRYTCCTCLGRGLCTQRTSENPRKHSQLNNRKNEIILLICARPHILPVASLFLGPVLSVRSKSWKRAHARTHTHPAEPLQIQLHQSTFGVRILFLFLFPFARPSPCSCGYTQHTHCETGELLCAPHFFSLWFILLNSDLWIIVLHARHVYRTSAHRSQMAKRRTDEVLIKSEYPKYLVFYPLGAASRQHTHTHAPITQLVHSLLFWFLFILFAIARNNENRECIRIRAKHYFKEK